MSLLHRVDWLIALLLGAIATLGFAPFSFWPAPVLALAMLFVLCADRGWKKAALLGWLFGLTHFASGIYWVFISTHVYGGAPAWLGVLLVVVLCVYLAIYPALVCGIAARLVFWRSAGGWLLVPALWLSSELLRGWVYTGFPWLSLGYVALDMPAERIAPLIGTHGLSFLFAASAYGVSRSFSASGWQRPFALGIALLPLIGVLAPVPEYWTQDSAPPLRVAIVQGNVPQDQKWDLSATEEILQRYRAMTLAAADAELVVWPEAVPNVLLEQLDEYFSELDAQLRQKDATLLAGVLIRGESDAVFNSMITLGGVPGRYDKRHLVPFGEYFPIPAWLRPIMDVLDLPYGDISSGAEARAAVQVRGQTLGISICFEDVFGDEFMRASRDAGILVNATNDAWFAHSSAPYQHLQIARMRALENGRWLVRATNTGISALIAPSGRLSGRSSMYETEILRGEVVPRQGLTPYARWGDVPLWVIGFGILTGGVLRHARHGLRQAGR